MLHACPCPLLGTFYTQKPESRDEVSSHGQDPASSCTVDGSHLPRGFRAPRVPWHSSLARQDVDLEVLAEGSSTLRKQLAESAVAVAPHRRACHGSWSILTSSLGPHCVPGRQAGGQFHTRASRFGEVPCLAQSRPLPPNPGSRVSATFYSPASFQSFPGGTSKTSRIKVPSTESSLLGFTAVPRDPSSVTERKASRYVVSVGLAPSKGASQAPALWTLRLAPAPSAGCCHPFPGPSQGPARPQPWEAASGRIPKPTVCPAVLTLHVSRKDYIRLLDVSVTFLKHKPCSLPEV